MARQFIVFIPVYFTLILLAKGVPITDFCKNKDNGNYRNPTSCDTFITCAHEHAWIMDCPLDLVYDVGQDKCDYKENVDCGSSDTGESQVSRSDMAVSIEVLRKRAKYFEF